MVTSIKGNDTSTFGGNIDVPQIVTDAPAQVDSMTTVEELKAATLPDVGI